MRLLTGTSGWQYKEWKGSFYPEDLPTDEMLSFYADHFSTVEVNNTFYRMPKASVLENWAASVPSDFRFVLKASRRITHFSRLKESAAEPLDYMLSTAETLGDQLGPILFQLPPNLKKDLDRLKEFLDRLPDGLKSAFEFRNPSWEDEEVAELLRDHDAALCIASSEEAETPFQATASYGYLRLRKTAYADGEIDRWIQAIRSQKWDEVYVFFKHEDEGTGPRLADKFAKAFG